jgi:hypothetical protein
MGAAHSLNQLGMTTGCDQAYATTVTKQPAHGRGEMGIRVKHHIDRSRFVAGEFDERRRDGLQPFVPAFPTVAGHQQPWTGRGLNRSRRQGRFDREQRIDACIASNMNLSEDLLGTKVRGCPVSWSEEQIGPGVDRCPIFLFRPRQQQIVRPEPGLDMRNRNGRNESGKRRAERARRIALDHEKVRRVAEQGQHRSGHRTDVRVGIGLPWTTEMHATEIRQSKVLRIEVGMLTGDE